MRKEKHFPTLTPVCFPDDAWQRSVHLLPLLQARSQEHYKHQTEFPVPGVNVLKLFAAIIYESLQ
jgi:hypothetical protein